MDWLYKKELALTNKAKLNKTITSRLFYVSKAFANKKVDKTATPASIPKKLL